MRPVMLPAMRHALEPEVIDGPERKNMLTRNWSKSSSGLLVQTITKSLPLTATRSF
jgi:hypothetical protein